jgi:hypothetical protein
LVPVRYRYRSQGWPNGARGTLPFKIPVLKWKDIFENPTHAKYYRYPILALSV